jgi:hypothetical protein
MYLNTFSIIESSLQYKQLNLRVNSQTAPQSAIMLVVAVAVLQVT